MDVNKLIARVKALLLTPRTEWPIIADEPASAADLYKNYIAILALIPAVFTFIKMSFIGMSVPFAGTIRIGVGAGLKDLVIGYILSLVLVYVLALIINALAPTFGAQKNQEQALKVVAYAYTASWVSGVGQIVPYLSILILFAGGLYSIYLLYLGLPSTMKCPPQKAMGYTITAILIAIVLNILVAAVLGTNAMFSISRNNDVIFDKDSSLGRLDQWSRDVEQAGKKIEAAQKAGDSQAQAEAVNEMIGAALGGTNVEPLPLDRLKTFVPESLMGRARTDLTARNSMSPPMKYSKVNATYADDSGRVARLEITDTGGARLLLTMAGLVGEREQQSSNGYEKTYRSDGAFVREKWHDNRGEYTVLVGDRFSVSLTGDAEDIDDLKEAVQTVDLRGLAALRNLGVAKN